MKIMGLCFFLALVTAAAAVWGIVRNVQLTRSNPDRTKLLSPLTIAMIGTFAVIALLHAPMYWDFYANDPPRWLQTLLSSLHHALRTFILDGEPDPIHDFVTEAANRNPGHTLYYQCYLGLTLLMYVAAPVMTFGAVLSMFRDLRSYVHILRCGSRHRYVFSELNMPALAIAKDLKLNGDVRDYPDGKGNPKLEVVFTGVGGRSEEEDPQLLQRASAIGAICLKSGINSLPDRLFRGRYTTFVVLGDDEEKTVTQAMQLARQFGDDPTALMYLLARSPESARLINSLTDMKMQLRRIDVERSVLYHNLNDCGEKIFEAAVERGTTHVINAILVGMGPYGQLMLKTLTWYGQMLGYELNIHAFDIREDVEGVMRVECPELLDDQHNGNTNPNESMYTITFHNGVDVRTSAFYEILESIGEVTYALVACGDDSLNIDVATRVREWCMRRNQRPRVPRIEAVVYDPQEVELLESTFEALAIDIHLVGDEDHSYTARTLFNSELEQRALKLHTQGYGAPEESFWKDEYSLRSSVAAVLHEDLRRRLHMPGAELLPKDRPDEIRTALRCLEHRRWNAYVRSEGYVYSGSTDPASRNRKARTHHLLVPYDELSLEEQEKDDAWDLMAHGDISKEEARHGELKAEA